MNRLIQHLEIRNFKSIQDLSLDCERINLFIGKPNAGKSNILEAISLFGAGYSEGRFMEKFIRYKTIAQLFTNFNFRNPIEVKTQSTKLSLVASEQGGAFKFEINPLAPRSVSPAIVLTVPPNGSMVKPPGTKSNIPDNSSRFLVKKYSFQSIGAYKEKELFLHPPHGDNFYFIARSNQELRNEIQAFLQPNGLDFLLDVESQQMSVIQKEKDSFLRIPMALVPDTFQRYIFHLAAILSNQNSVLLFEEPETHSYAPYVYQLAQYILQDDRKNQYFITTHNPYFLLPILQEAKDAAVFVTWFEDYQTHVRRLSPDEIREMLDHGMDIFLNLDSLVPA